MNRPRTNRDLLYRLRRWAACDSFAASQEPSFQEEYAARADLCIMLADLMESDQTRSWRDAMLILTEAAERQKRKDHDVQVREADVEMTLLKDPRAFERATVRPPPLHHIPITVVEEDGTDREGEQ